MTLKTCSFGFSMEVNPPPQASLCVRPWPMFRGVCLLVTVRGAKWDEPVEMKFGCWLGWAPGTVWWGNFGGHFLADPAYWNVCFNVANPYTNRWAYCVVVWRVYSCALKERNRIRWRPSAEIILRQKRVISLIWKVEIRQRAISRRAQSISTDRCSPVVSSWLSNVDFKSLIVGRSDCAKFLRQRRCGLMSNYFDHFSVESVRDTRNRQRRRRCMHVSVRSRNFCTAVTLVKNIRMC